MATKRTEEESNGASADQSLDAKKPKSVRIIKAEQRPVGQTPFSTNPDASGGGRMKARVVGIIFDKGRLQGGNYTFFNPGHGDWCF